jgi:hypothetical protein
VFYAGIFGFKERPYFSATAGAETPPKVQFDFGKPAAQPEPEKNKGADLNRPQQVSSCDSIRKPPLLPGRLRANQEQFRSPRRIVHLAVSIVCALFLVASASTADAAEKIPLVPNRYFTDYAGVVSAETANRLNKTLEDFERETSNQILAVIYPKMESDSSIEDYTVRVAQAWRVGQKAKSNGAVLFVFVQDHKMFLQVGYGLEGPLPDVLAKRIIDNEIKPRFRNGDFDGGMSAGVPRFIAATKGEYKGTGRTAGDRSTEARQEG